MKPLNLFLALFVTAMLCTQNGHALGNRHNKNADQSVEQNGVINHGIVGEKHHPVNTSENNVCCEKKYSCNSCPTICYVPEVKYCRKDYCVKKCYTVDKTCYKKCTRYKPEYYEKTFCRYVPEYYKKTFCRQVPECYYTSYCVPETKYYYENHCKYEPVCNYKKVCSYDKCAPACPEPCAKPACNTCR